MADIVLQRDLAALTKAAPASAFTSLTAAGAGDNTAVVGLTIDRLLLGMPGVAVFVLMFQAILAAAATLTLKAIVLQHSDDGTTWVTYVPPVPVPIDPGIVATGATGGSTERGCARVQVNLSSAKRYVRMGFTPDLSAGATDTATVVSVAALAGFSRLPPA